MRDHIVVSGDDALATTIVEELKTAGANIVKLSGDDLADVDLGHAVAIICAGDDDDQTSKSRCWQGKPTRTSVWLPDWPTMCCAKRWPPATVPAQSSTSPT
ncbi:hypothetical protein MSIMFI_02842 [Mycobacterium simulans]|nr:hypothetical protein MSIMFI_02842 [Mycobacterium simulans]